MTIYLLHEADYNGEPYGKVITANNRVLNTGATLTMAEIIAMYKKAELVILESPKP